MSILHDFDGIITDRFVETGTFEGMSLWNASLRFKECLSVEIDAGLYRQAFMKFSTVQNIKLYFGHSPDFLRQVIDPRISTTFWLDAHYHGTKLPEGTVECPLMQELQEIVKWQWRVPPIILIDDAEIFLSGPPSDYHKEEWPRVAEIDEVLKGYTRTLRGDALLYKK